MRRLLVLSFTALACLLAVLPILAADGAIPIWEPTTITEPGKYVVTRNIFGVPSNPVLTIASSNVQVDLGGFRLSNDGNGPVVLADNVESIVVNNGTVLQEGGDDGIRFQGVRHFAIRYMTVTKTGTNEAGINIVSCENGTVEHNTAGGSFELSLWISGGRNVIARHNVLSNTDCEAGVALDGDYSTLADNLLEACSNIRVHGSGNRIVNNDVRTHPWYNAITVSGSRNRIEDNTLIDNGNFGLRFEGQSSDNFYSGNVARGNNGDPAYCSNPSGTADFCDEGTNNTSHGDNYMPGKM